MKVLSSSGVSIADPIRCRLCGGEARFFGEKKVLQRISVKYYKCEQCGSLQTEDPYWLKEAYQVNGLGLDVGACQRCLGLSLEVSAVLHVLSISKHESCLDYGSGLGLFARFMRDRGNNFYVYDKYIQPFFMDRFKADLGGMKWRVLTAFEVFEHLVTPSEELNALFSVDPDIFFFTTQTWQNQGMDWWYLAPEGGQHVMFFSEEALQNLAEKNGYAYVVLPTTRVFIHRRLAGSHAAPSTLEKCIYSVRRHLIRRGASLPTRAEERLQVLNDGKTLRKLALALFLKHQRRPFHWVEKDYEALRAAVSSPPAKSSSD